jgi:hypothetical protein
MVAMIFARVIGFLFLVVALFFMYGVAYCHFRERRDWGRFLGYEACMAMVVAVGLSAVITGQL